MCENENMTLGLKWLGPNFNFQNNAMAILVGKAPLLKKYLK